LNHKVLLERIIDSVILILKGLRPIFVEDLKSLLFSLLVVGHDLCVAILLDADSGALVLVLLEQDADADAVQEGGEGDGTQHACRVELQLVQADHADEDVMNKQVGLVDGHHLHLIEVLHAIVDVY